MRLILLGIVFFLIAYGLYSLLAGLLMLPSSAARNALRYRLGKPSFSKQLENKLLSPAIRLLAKLLPMSEYRERHMRADFDRLGKEQEPRKFVAETIVKSVAFALVGLLLIPLGIPILFVLVAVGAVLNYFRAMQDIQQKVGNVNRELQLELPRLVETLNYTLEDNRDLLSFMIQYRKVAGVTMSRELDKLIFEMKTGNHTIALRNLEARLQLPQFSSLVSILCGVHQGVDQRTALQILEQSLRTQQREQLRRESEKRPGRVKAASFILTMIMIVMFMVPLVMLIIRNMSSVGF